MSSYHVFIFNPVAANGGLDDYEGSFETKEEARNFIMTHYSGMWAKVQIVEEIDGELVEVEWHD